MSVQMGREPFKPSNEELLAVIQKVEGARDEIRGVAHLIERPNPAAHKSCLMLMAALDDLKDEIANTPKPENRYEDTTPHADLWDRQFQKAEEEMRRREQPRGPAW